VLASQLSATEWGGGGGGEGGDGGDGDGGDGGTGISAPVPLTAIAVDAFAASLTRDTIPVMLPGADGVKSTTKNADWPAFNVLGRAGAVTLKPSPMAFVFEIVTLAAMAVTVTVCELLLPTGTVPKASEVRSAAN
jgi:hypothetical protein